MLREARYLLVDGHSVLFAVPELARIHRKEQRLARHLLRTRLERLHDISPWRVTLVFDGRLGQNDGSVLGGTANPMVVIYSRADQTADSIIERLTHQAPDPTRVTVVTADRAEQLTVEAAGAEVRSPEWLMAECSAIDQEWEREVMRHLEKGRTQGQRLFD
ncbi:MAG: hypothetical protein OHK005_07550 [Candidatus Methylacidiphilales bacterium]